MGVQGDRDPGYGATSKMITEAALCLVDDLPRLAAVERFIAESPDYAWDKNGAILGAMQGRGAMPSFDASQYSNMIPVPQ